MIWSRNLQQEKEECIFSWSCATYEVAVETTIISTKTVTVELTYFYKNWNGNHCRAMLPSVVRYYHTGHPRKKILFEPKSIRCIDRGMHILQQKCIFSWPTIFLRQFDRKETRPMCLKWQKMYFLATNNPFCGWWNLICWLGEWMRKKPGQFLFCYKKCFFCAQQFSLQTMGRNLSAPVITITDHYITQWWDISSP